jgi:hypothetical protein
MIRRAAPLQWCLRPKVFQLIRREANPKVIQPTPWKISSITITVPSNRKLDQGRLHNRMSAIKMLANPPSRIGHQPLQHDQNDAERDKPAPFGGARTEIEVCEGGH